MAASVFKTELTLHFLNQLASCLDPQCIDNMWLCHRLNIESVLDIYNRLYIIGSEVNFQAETCTFRS